MLCCVALRCVTITFVTPDLSSGKTVWSTTPVSWSGQRRPHGLVESVSKSDFETAAAYVVSESTSVHRSLYTSQPSWCSFQGVTCGSVSGSSSYASVISISLDNLILSGTLPSQIGSFGSMTYLPLIGNQISGSIPSSICALTLLAYFSVHVNRLTGSIPASIGSQLQVFDIYINSLTGSIPLSISACTRLTCLFLSVNSLTGSIPASIGSLVAIQRVYFDNNYLTGSIPPSMSAMTGLTVLALSVNRLTG